MTDYGVKVFAFLVERSFRTLDVDQAIKWSWLELRNSLF